MKCKTFNEVIVEFSAGSDFGEAVKEMKLLSEKIGMPVRSEFNGVDLTVTSNTDVVKMCNDFFKNHMT